MRFSRNRSPLAHPGSKLGDNRVIDPQGRTLDFNSGASPDSKRRRRPFRSRPFRSKCDSSFEQVGTDAIAACATVLATVQKENTGHASLPNLSEKRESCGVRLFRFQRDLNLLLRLQCGAVTA